MRNITDRSLLLPLRIDSKASRRKPKISIIIEHYRQKILIKCFTKLFLCCRFDINIKDATTLGIVGAGGIGAALIQCINSRRWTMVGSFILAMIVLMLIIEFASTRIRGKLARGQ